MTVTGVAWFDAVRRVQGDPLDDVPPLLIRAAQLGHPLAERERLAEVQVGPAEPVGLRPGEVDQPADVFGPLSGPARLGGHRADLVQLFVHDGHRDDQGFGARGGLDRVDHVAHDAVRRRPQLAGAGPAALDGPAEILTVADQLADVGAQRELVHRLVLCRPADVDDAGAAGQVVDRKEVEVGPAQGERRAEPVAVQRHRHRRTVQIRPVGEEEQQRVLAIEPVQPARRLLVHQQLVRAEHPRRKPGPGAHGPRAVHRAHLPQVAGGLGGHLARVAAERAGQLGQPSGEPVIGQQLVNLRSVRRDPHAASIPIHRRRREATPRRGLPSLSAAGRPRRRSPGRPSGTPCSRCSRD